MVDAKSKKKNKWSVSSGVAHIKASFNNTIINIADKNGETIIWTAAGSVGFKGSRKSTPYAAQVAAEDAVRRATEFGVHKLDIVIIRPRTILGDNRLGIFSILFEWIEKNQKLPVLNHGNNFYQFVDIEDLVVAIYKSSLLQGSNVFNIGAEKFDTIKNTGNKTSKSFK